MIYNKILYLPLYLKPTQEVADYFTLHSGNFILEVKKALTSSDSPLRGPMHCFPSFSYLIGGLVIPKVFS